MDQVFKISEAASLALHAVVYLGFKSDLRMSTKDISEAFGFSEAHLSKVLQRLGRVGLVKPIRGPKGGFILAKPLQQITLLEVYEAIDGPVPSDPCVVGTKVCKSKHCIFGDLVTNVNKLVKKHLKETKVSDVSHICKNM